MDISIFDIILRPHVSTKVYRLNQQHKQLVIDVHPQANKPMIKEALKKLFNVEAQKVNIVVSQGKFRRSGRHIFKDALAKKAIVTLKEGQSINAMNLAAATNAQESKGV